ncbi:unnamed protein product [Cuscuta campestris]|uniref:RRM domain-containing protein n=1 Tax=Cuscuta campestris TaxID=132261 RepID=A0A484KS66_9ASTE|nr:unnamed protein product [Cuscuta campestris]
MARKHEHSPEEKSDEEEVEVEEVEVEEEVEEEEEEESGEEEGGGESEEVEEEEGDESEEEEEESDSDSSDEAEDESSKPESIRRLLEPLGKDKIMDLFKQAASKDPSLISRVTELANSDPTHRKVFVHGLSWDATTDTVRDAFQCYGEIEECRLITDKVTGKAKGYAFVLFKTRASAKRALKQPQKKMGNRTISCQLAAVGPVGYDTTGRKIYVGNVGPNVIAENLRSFFSKFGEIEEGPSGFDAVTQRPRGFAIFVFRTAEGAKKALEEPIKWFEGCQLHCKMFVEYVHNNSNKAHANQAVQQSGGGIGVQQGMLGAGGMFMGQSHGMGLTANPFLGLATPAVGGSSIGANSGLASLNPSTIGNLGFHMGLQGLGAYQNAPLAPSFSGGGTGSGPASSSSPPPNTQSSFGSAGAYFPSYLGR